MEIGSEFYLTEDSKKQGEFAPAFSAFYKSFFRSGRDSLRFILSLVDAERIYFPNYICGSVVNCLTEKCGNIIPYAVNQDFSIDTSFLSKLDGKKTTVVYLNNYFGLSDESSLLDILKGMNVTVIYDVTHSLFNSVLPCLDAVDFCIASVRKWLPVTGGGVVLTKYPLNLPELAVDRELFNIKYSAMRMKKEYLFESGGVPLNSEYRRLFSEAEERLDKCFENNGIYGISDFSARLIENYDYFNMREKRRRNYRYLYDRLPRLIKPVFPELPEGAVPLVLPVYANNRDRLRTFLIDNKIYCAVHWPLDIDILRTRENGTINGRILSLPVDQRYGEEDMHRMYEVLEKFEG